MCQFGERDLVVRTVAELGVAVAAASLGGCGGGDEHRRQTDGEHGGEHAGRAQLLAPRDLSRRSDGSGHHGQPQHHGRGGDDGHGDHLPERGVQTTEQAGRQVAQQAVELGWQAGIAEQLGERVAHREADEGVAAGDEDAGGDDGGGGDERSAATRPLSGAAESDEAGAGGERGPDEQDGQQGAGDEPYPAEVDDDRRLVDAGHGPVDPEVGAALVLLQIDDHPLGLAGAVRGGHGRERGAQIPGLERARHGKLEAFPVGGRDGIEQDAGDQLRLVRGERHRREAFGPAAVPEIVGELEGVGSEVLDVGRVERTQSRDRVREVLVGEHADAVEQRLEREDGIELVLVTAEIGGQGLECSVDGRLERAGWDDNPEVRRHERVVDGEAGEQVAGLVGNGGVGQHLVVEPLVAMAGFHGVLVPAGVEHGQPQGQQHGGEQEGHHEPGDEQNPTGPPRARRSWSALGERPGPSLNCLPRV